MVVVVVVLDHATVRAITLLHDMIVGLITLVLVERKWLLSGHEAVECHDQIGVRDKLLSLGICRFVLELWFSFSGAKNVAGDVV